MDENTSHAGGSSINWPLAARWGLASFLVNFIITTVGAFLLGEHALSGGETIGVSVVIAVINGVTCAVMLDELHARLRAAHWLVAGVIASLAGWFGTFLGPGLMGASASFASGFVLMGMPLGYLVAQTWAKRPAAPQGHPDNID